MAECEPDPASPCTGLCTMHPRAGLCVGCLRDLAEIAAWPTLDADARRRILAALPGREAQIRKRRRLAPVAPVAPPGPGKC